MLAGRTFRTAAVVLAALGSGVGVALAAAGDPPVLSQFISVPSRDSFYEQLGSIDRSADVYPIGGHVDWGDGTPTSTQDIACPDEAAEPCLLFGGHAYADATPTGTATTKVYTVTNAVTLTTPTGTVQRTATGPIEVSPHGEPRLGADTIDFGPVAVGTTATRTLTIANDAVADRAFHLTVADVTGDFFVVAHDCRAVEPGTSCTLELGARPMALGLQDGGIQLEFGGDDDDGVELRVTGRPAPPTTTETVTRTVTTPPGPPVTVTTPGATVTVRVPAPAAACVVPDLAGKTRTAAQRALERARCALGTVSRPRRGTSLVVASQTVKAGTKRAAGTKVGVRLAPKARSARRR